MAMLLSPNPNIYASMKRPAQVGSPTCTLNVHLPICLLSERDLANDLPLAKRRYLRLSIQSSRVMIFFHPVALDGLETLLDSALVKEGHTRTLRFCST